MARLTITLSDARRIKSARSAEDLVAKARARAALGEPAALRAAVQETRAARRQIRGQGRNS